VFHGQTWNKSIHKENEGGKTIELLNPTKIIATIRAGQYRIPENLELIHAYHPNSDQLTEFNFTMSKLASPLSLRGCIKNKNIFIFDAMQGNSAYKAKLLIRQKGLCGLCGTTLLDEKGEFNFDGSNHIHHVEARAKKGSKGLLKNMKLVHAQCHQRHHQLRGAKRKQSILCPFDGSGMDARS
jgi:5-methylcytosine-specific restriction endonuclease McrA